MKYGEITIVYEKDETESFFSFFGLFKKRIIKNIVILFDDGDIYDTKTKYEDKNYDFLWPYSGFEGRSVVPRYFDTKKNIYFKHEEVTRDGELYLNYDKTVFDNTIYKIDNLHASEYNCIYYKNRSLKKINILYLLRLKSSNESPRHVVFYDTDEFNKSEIIYLIHTIFTHE